MIYVLQQFVYKYFFEKPPKIVFRVCSRRCVLREGTKK